MTDSELVTACLERSGLTKKQFCQDILAGRSVVTLNRWLSGQAIPRDARRFLERYHQKLVNQVKGALNYQAGLRNGKALNDQRS